MKEKIAVLMEETGCRQSEAELALELSGYDLESAVREVSRLSKSTGVLKGSLACPGQTLYGLVLVVLNLRSRSLLRARAVLSHHPATCTPSVESDWFEFEKNLYAARLAEGAVQTLSQEMEKRLADLFLSPEALPLYEQVEGGRVREGVPETLNDFFSRFFKGFAFRLNLKAEVLSAAGTTPLPAAPGVASEGRRGSPGAAGMVSLSTATQPGPLVLRVALEGDSDGMLPEELRPGDVVCAQIIDSRDIAQYLAKLFGGRSAEGLIPLSVPVESSGWGPLSEGTDITLRVRFSRGVYGEVRVPAGLRLKVSRKPE